jgi:hypothetical protein
MVAIFWTWHEQPSNVRYRKNIRQQSNLYLQNQERVLHPDMDFGKRWFSNRASYIKTVIKKDIYILQQFQIISVFYSVHINRLTSTNRSTLNNFQLGTNTHLSTFIHDMNSSFRFLVGAYNNTNDDGELIFLNGHISEIVFVDSDNATQLDSVQNYLKHKYHPPMNLGADVVQSSFCNSTLTATAGFTNLLWSNGATSSSIAVNTSGNYWVRGTDAFGFVWYDTIQVTYPSIPQPINTAICVGESNTWNADMGAGYTYLWSTGATTPSMAHQYSGNV